MFYSITSRPFAKGQYPSFCNFSRVILFRYRIIWSRKKLYLSTNISRRIAWNPPNQTFVCSAIEELKYHALPSSPSSSGYLTGLQLLWQNLSLTKCLQLKWKTSTVSPMFLKKGSSLTCLAREQLLSKKRWLGFWPLMLNVRFTNSFIEERMCQFFVDLMEKKLTAQVAIASAPKKVSRARIIPQGATKICSLWVLLLPNCAEILFLVPGEPSVGSGGGEVPRRSETPSLMPWTKSSSTSNSSSSSSSISTPSSTSSAIPSLGCDTRCRFNFSWSWTRDLPLRV